MYGLTPIPSYPFPGSAVVLWDFDSPAPPDANLPPTAGRDPHGAGGSVPEVLLFTVLAVVMTLTRRLDWYRLGGSVPAQA